MPTFGDISLYFYVIAYRIWGTLFVSYSLSDNVPIVLVRQLHHIVLHVPCYSERAHARICVYVCVCACAVCVCVSVCVCVGGWVGGWMAV